MRVGCISSARIPSDTANSIQVMKVCQALSQEGHEVTLFVPHNQTGSHDWDQLAIQYGLQTQFEVQWISLALGRRFFPWQAAWQALRSDIDLFYVWPIQSAVAGLLFRKKVVLEMHDLPTGKMGPIWYRLFLRKSGQKKLLVITQALQKALENIYGKLPDREVVIGPNGVDLTRYQNLPGPSDSRKQLGLPTRQLVGCTGHLYAGRGVELFLDLAKRFSDVTFLWVGGRREDVEIWQARAQESELENVIFTGFIANENLPLYQAAADILLLPYGREIEGSSGMNTSEIYSSMKMFEYLAVGRAIISSDVPVIREVLDDKIARLCSINDVEVWADVLESLLDNDGERNHLAQNAMEIAKNYTWQKRIKNTLGDW